MLAATHLRKVRCDVATSLGLPARAVVGTRRERSSLAWSLDILEYVVQDDAHRMHMLPLCCSVYSLPSSKSMPASPPSPQALTPREDPLIPGPLALCLSCSPERSRLRSLGIRVRLCARWLPSHPTWRHQCDGCVGICPVCAFCRLACRGSQQPARASLALRLMHPLPDTRSSASLATHSGRQQRRAAHPLDVVRLPLPPRAAGTPCRPSSLRTRPTGQAWP